MKDSSGNSAAKEPSAKRFFLGEGLMQSGALVTMDEEDAHHAQRVMRMRRGDLVELLDGQGGHARGTIAETGRIVSVQLQEVWREQKSGWSVTVASAVPKGQWVEIMVDQLVQVGVERWVAMSCDRSVVEPRTTKLDRLRKRVRESCKQSGRSYEMKIETQVLGFEQVLQQREKWSEPECAWIADVSGRNTGEWRRVMSLANLRGLVLIGPEGGWSQAELTAADQAGLQRWKLGPHVLRVETAAVVSAALLMGISSQT